MSFLQFLVSKTDKIIFLEHLWFWQPVSRMVLNNPCLLVLTLWCVLLPHCTGLSDSTVWQK